MSEVPLYTRSDGRHAIAADQHTDSVGYRGTSLIRSSAPLGPYSGTIPRVRWGSLGRGLFLLSEIPLYLHPHRGVPRASVFRGGHIIPETDLSGGVEGCTYRDTRLIRKRHPLGPYSRPMPEELWWC